ncbi:conserved hypothetical protein [Neospora caninum Liverpool]|nr:conserved hypothetical protein [Neospora caninum Liverpool]CBZ51211.1 conserved hypothetical protein [Neospora caninum Liverpool]|eukprot:XP_003881244.1 conserved hypothetical protein [Neospora caninum Liverpool]
MGAQTVLRQYSLDPATRDDAATEDRIENSAAETDPRLRPQSGVHTPGNAGVDGASGTSVDLPSEASLEEAAEGKSVAKAVRFVPSSDKKRLPNISLDEAIAAQSPSRPAGGETLHTDAACSFFPSSPSEGHGQEEVARRRIVLRERAGPLPTAAGNHAERIDALLSMSLDDAAVAMNGTCASSTLHEGRGRRGRGRPPATGAGQNARAPGDGDLDSRARMSRRRQRFAEDDFDEEGDMDDASDGEAGSPHDEAEEDDSEMAPWVRAFRKALLLPLSVGTHGWKYLDRVEPGEPLANAALLAFSGSRRLTETDVDLFFEPFHPTAVLQLVPSSFFIVLFPSAAAAHAALNQRGERCMHLLTSGLEQLRQLQANAVAARAEARRRRGTARRLRAKTCGKGTGHGDGCRGADPVERSNEPGREGEAKAGERDEGMRVEVEMNDGEGSDTEEKEEGELDDDAVLTQDQAQLDDDADLPEVFWLIRDVETYFGAKAAAEFETQAEHWRRTLPILPSSWPRTATRLLLRVATAQELQRCSEAEPQSSLGAARHAPAHARLHRHASSLPQGQEETLCEMLPSGVLLREAKMLSSLSGPASSPSPDPGARRDESARLWRSTPGLSADLSLDAIQEMLRAERRGQRREEEKAAIARTGRLTANGDEELGEERDRNKQRTPNLEEEELLRDQTLLTTLGGDFRSRILRRRTGAPDLGAASERVSQPSP